jgi:hypothetical protein
METKRVVDLREVFGDPNEAVNDREARLAGLPKSARDAHIRRRNGARDHRRKET